MKLVHPRIDCQFDFNKSQFYNLVVENPNEFFLLTQQIINQSEGKEGEWSLSEILPIELQKNLIALYDYYNLSCNSKKVENLLKSEIVKISTSLDFCEIISKINKDVLEFDEMIISNLPFKILSNNELGLDEICKISKFTFSEKGGLLERIVNYIDVYSHLTSIKVVVLIGITNVLNKTELISLIKDVNYRGLNVLIIEIQDKGIIDKKSTIIIDNDLCII